MDRHLNSALALILYLVLSSTVEASFMEPTVMKNSTSLESFCSVTEIGSNITVACKVDSNRVFSFVNFREWSKEKDNSSIITLSIECQYGGIVHLPWPYRSHYLVNLFIRHCDLRDKYAEYNETHVFSHIEDQLEIVELVNCVHNIDFSDYSEYSELVKQRTISPEFECGFQNIVRYVLRNVTSKMDFGDYFEDYDYDETYPDIASESQSDGVTKNGTDAVSELSASTKSPHEQELKEEADRQSIVRASVSMKHTCNYPNWEYYELSNNKEIGRFHLQGLTANSNIPKLTTINFTNTFQSFVQNELLNWRLHFPKLEILDMVNSSVSQFNFRDYTIGEIDGYINLQYNNISSLHQDELKSFQMLKSTIIDIRNNPFDCQCDTVTDFVEFLTKHENPKKAVIHADYEYLWELKCVSPQRFKGRKISELSKEILCNLDTTVYIAQIASLCIVILVLLIIIILMLKYHREIRILVFTRLHIVLPCEPTEDDKHFTYDAFISYSSQDAEWVLKTLAKNLEDPETGNGLSLCLHHRDFQVGEYICDNIVASVEKSRHTVLIVSKHFLKSEWCVFEFREALRKSLLNKRKHMVIVLLEEVDSENLESDFRRCLQTMTNMKVDDSLFWDRIKFTLAPKSRANAKDSTVTASKEPNTCHSDKSYNLDANMQCEMEKV